MLKKSLVILFSLGLSTNLAFADDHADAGGTWFGAVDFSTNLSTDVSPEDNSSVAQFILLEFQKISTHLGVLVLATIQYQYCCSIAL